MAVHKKWQSSNPIHFGREGHIYYGIIFPFAEMLKIHSGFVYKKWHNYGVIDAPLAKKKLTCKTNKAWMNTLVKKSQCSIDTPTKRLINITESK